MFNRELLIDGLNEGDRAGAEYVEIRYQDKYIANYQFKDGEFNSNVGSREGVCVRVLFEGSWGLASTNNISSESIIQAVRDAISLARGTRNYKSEPVTLAEVDIVEEKAVSPRKIDLRDIDIDTKIQRILEAVKHAEHHPSVKSLIISYNEMIDHRIVITNEGTRVEWEDMKPTVMAYAVAIENGKFASGYSSWSHTCGGEFFNLHPFDELVEEAATKATKLVHATLPPAGVQSLLLDPQLVGVLAHEAVGHTAEADLVLAGSFTKGKLGQKVCDERITLVDAPTKEGTKWMGAGWLPFDDEGVRGRTVEIIKNGIMNGYMTNRALAAELNVEPTGNARAFTFGDEPIVRMRNTYIEPGDMSIEELAEAIGTGFMLRSLQNGQADSSGEFMFGVVEAFAIKDGEITDEIYQGPVLTGNAFKVLSNIIGIGKEFDINLGSGFCGKEQPAKVDAGGPYLAVKAMLAGGK
ncbi:MAG: TldD/PmbA family protein [Candidatus Heimdallarchaeaceae archaeon]